MSLLFPSSGLVVRASREIKNELGQFLNGDFASTQTLGSVGFYRGKHVEFDWQTSLNELGVIVAAPADQHQIDLFYNSKGSVSIKLAGKASKVATIKMDFTRRGAIAAESYKLRAISYDLPSLGSALRKFVQTKKWNRHWVILTKKYVTDGFSFWYYQRWSHFLRQPAKVDSPMQRTIHHEDAETVFGGVQGQGRA